MIKNSKLKKGLLITALSLLAAGPALFYKGVNLSDPDEISLPGSSLRLPITYYNFLSGAACAETADWYIPESGYSGASQPEAGKKYTLGKLITLITSDRFQEWQDGYEGRIEFALFDSENDGNKELAVRLNGIGIDGPEDSSTATIILKEVNGKLLLCDAFETWSRGEGTLYYYGFREGGGSAGAGEHFYEAYFIDGSGYRNQIYVCETLTGPWIEKVQEDAARLYHNRYDGIWPEALQVQIYTINGKEYYCYSTDKAEDPMIETLLSCLEEQGIRFASAQEIDGLIDERRRDLEIAEEWLGRKKPDWQELADLPSL